MYVYIIYIGGSIILSIIFFLDGKKRNRNFFFLAIEKDFFCKIYMKIVLFFNSNSYW